MRSSRQSVAIGWDGRFGKEGPLPIPGAREIGGYTAERIIRAPHAGLWQPLAAIGDSVKAGCRIARVGKRR